jgi:hypothetical protein
MDWFDLVELLLELLFELVVPVLEELLAILAVRHQDRWDRSFPLLPILLWGAASGAVSCLIWRHRVIRGRPLVPGISLLLAPVLAGRVMRWVGERLRARGIIPTALASFRGGALFAFGMAAARFVCVALA